MNEFAVKDSGARMEFDSGMVRDTTEGKTDFSLVYDGPMLRRWAEHLTKGAVKYAPRNWMLARGMAEATRFKASAARHFFQWMIGDRDEDHAAAVYFNINGYEYVKGQYPKKEGQYPKKEERETLPIRSAGKVQQEGVGMARPK